MYEFYTDITVWKKRGNYQIPGVRITARSMLFVEKYLPGYLRKIYARREPDIVRIEFNRLNCLGKVGQQAKGEEVKPLGEALADTVFASAVLPVGTTTGEEMRGAIEVPDRMWW